MSDGLLTILKLFFLALLYLFFFRVLRAVWAELTAPAVTAAPAGTPAGRGSAVRGGARTPMRLKVVEPAADRGRTYDLGDELTAGRASGCQISLPDDTFVSQLHARIFRRDGQIYVEDLGSTNGTFLNRKKVSSPQPLRRGDRLQIGKTVLELGK
jgi:pSer/pThr/pTyr-binding forkhead associated (FHA) protein